MVEAQHHVSTLKLVDSLAEQAALEALLDATKPAVPPECAHLDFLLATPFRYAPYPTGSRFRRAGLGPGVFYASLEIETAAAEMAHLRALFYAESPDTTPPADAAQYTAFRVTVETAFAIDLTRPPLDRDAATWTHHDDYAATQALAEAFRGAGGEAILSQSARAPTGRRNLSVLSCAAFAAPQPLERRTWRLHVTRGAVRAICEFPPARLEFETAPAPG